MEKREYFKNIEFFRILFAIIIVVYHLFNYFSLSISLDNPLLIYMRQNAGEAGHTAVDLFFIISGFLLVMTLNTKLTVIEFLKKKFIRLFPVMLCMFGLSFVLHQFDIGPFNKYTYVLSLFFLNNVGLTTAYGLHATWFISVLVSVSTFYFYIIKHFEKKYSDLIIFILIMFSYAFLIHALKGSIDRGICQYYYVFSFGVMRGLAGIGIGIFIANIYNEYKAVIKSYKPTVLNIVIYSLLELYFFGFVTYNLLFHKISGNNDLIIILAFCVLFYLFILKRGILSKFFESNGSVVMGRYAFSLFLVHLYILDILKVCFWKHNAMFVQAHPIFNIIMPIAISMLCAFILYHFVEIPATKYLKKKLNNPESA